MLDAAYLIAMVAFAWWNLGRLGEEPPRWIELTLLVGAMAGVCSAVGGPGLFGMMRLASWGLFAVVPAWCLAAAWVCRSDSRIAAGSLTLAGAGLAAIAIDAFLVEPHALELTRYEVRSDKVTQPVRIALIADLQTDAPGEYERSALQLALDQQPDLLMFAGDYVQTHTEPEWRTGSLQLREIFDEVGLDAPRGGYAVQGNVDPPALWPGLFGGRSTRASPNTRTFRDGELSITTLSFRDGFDTGIVVPPAPGFHIVLAHAPDFALGEVSADLLLAGHTHGGQVRIPFLQLPILTFSKLPRSMGAGLTERDGRTLIVSRGIGMEREDAPRLRFNCRPELVIIDVVPR